MREPMTLTEIARTLEPRLLARVGSIHVTIQDGEAIARLTIALMVQGGEARLPDGTRITVDRDDLPVGVALTTWAAWPDIYRPVALTPAMEEQLAELEASGLVGCLDAIRNDHGPQASAHGIPRYSWVIKTHAGSREERIAWAMDRPLSSTAAAARDLGIAPRTVRQHAESLGVGTRLGRDLFFAPSDIERIRARVGKPGRPPATRVTD